MPLTTYVAGDVLTAQSLNDNFTFAADNPPGGLELVSTTTIDSAVSSVTVSGAFSATFDNYLILLSGGVASTTIGLTLQLGSTTTGYFASGFFNKPNATAFTGLGDDNAANFNNAGGGTTNNLDARIELYGPNLAKTTGFFAVRQEHATTGNQVYLRGFQNSTTQFTAFTFATGVNTITGGIIRVYGYKN